MAQILRIRRYHGLLHIIRIAPHGQYYTICAQLAGAIWPGLLGWRAGPDAENIENFGLQVVVVIVIALFAFLTGFARFARLGAVVVAVLAAFAAVVVAVLAAFAAVVAAVLAAFAAVVAAVLAAVVAAVLAAFAAGIPTGISAALTALTAVGQRRLECWKHGPFQVEIDRDWRRSQSQGQDAGRGQKGYTAFAAFTVHKTQFPLFLWFLVVFRLFPKELPV